MSPMRKGEDGTWLNEDGSPWTLEAFTREEDARERRAKVYAALVLGLTVLLVLNAGTAFAILDGVAGALHHLVTELPFWGYAARPVP